MRGATGGRWAAVSARSVAVLLGVLAAVAAAVLFGAGAAVADPPGTPDPAEAQPQSVRLAAALRTDPVYVTDQLPRVVPKSTKARFAALARRTGVPTYVMVLPDQGADQLLATVHDRLDRDGLYVLVDAMGVTGARAFGVDVPTEDASTITLYALPYDAGPLRSFREFVDAIASGPKAAAERANRLRTQYGDDDGESIGAHYIDRTDRDNQAFLTGIVLTGAPLSVVVLGLYARRRFGRHGTPVPEAVAALLIAAVVAVGAPQVFHQKVDSAAPAPTRSDMTARLDRVAAGLRHAQIYTDPESPQVLSPTQMTDLDKRIAAFGPGPVWVAVVPQLGDDESGGDDEAFVTALHRRVGKDGIYVVADPLRGNIGAYEYGLSLDPAKVTFGLPETIAYDRAAHESVDHRIGPRLDELMTYLGKVPSTGSPAQGPDEPAQALDDHRLPSLFSGDFAPGLVVGGLAAGLLTALVALLDLAVSLVARRRGKDARLARQARHAHAVPEGPARPSMAWLARAARHEVTVLAAEFAAVADDAEARGRPRAWECLDAAVLLAGAPGEPRGGAGAGDLAAAVVLARAGRAELAGAPYARVCGINPLHGRPVPEPGGRTKAKTMAKARARDERTETRRCEGCARAGLRGPAAVEVRRLVLPTTRRGGVRVPYEKAVGPIGVSGQGVGRLIQAAKEYASVR